MSTLRNFNWYGSYTLYKKEIKNFLKSYIQKVIAPIIASVTLFAVLNLAIGGPNQEHRQINPKDLMTCGLCMQIMLQSSFSATSSSIVSSKVIGYVYELLFPPLGNTAILLGHVIAALTQSLCVGALLFVLLVPFTQISIVNVNFIMLIYFSLSAPITLALLGMITGILSKNFSHMYAVMACTITPLSFLSCTFYPLMSLPAKLQLIILYNPLFYFIDGFRYSITGHNDVSIIGGVLVTTLSMLFFAFITKKLLDSGYGLKQ